RIMVASRRKDQKRYSHIVPGPTKIARMVSPRRRRLLIAGSALLLAPARAQEPPPATARLASALPLPEPTLEGFRVAPPEAQGFDSARLAAMQSPRSSLGPLIPPR